MRIETKPLTDQDLENMAIGIRPTDRFEFSLMSHGKPLEESLAGLQRKSLRARAAYFDGDLVAIYGVLAPTLLSQEGYPWFCATGLVRDRAIRREFIDRTRAEAAWLAEGFSLLWNIVWCENKTAIRWLKWIGFTFDGTEYVIQGHRFLKFHIGE